MAIYKKINNKDVKVADNKITDHNQLTGRDAFSSHPISAIRHLPEKLTTLKNKSIANEQATKNITLTEGDNGTLIFTNYKGEETVVQGGYLPDDETIKLEEKISYEEIELTEETYEPNTYYILVNTQYELATSAYDENETYYKQVTQDKMVAFALETEKEILTGERIREIITSKGGYLDSYNFNKVNPTQDELTEYAIQQIGNHAFVFLGINITQEEYDSYRYIYTYDSIQEEYIRSNSYSYDDAYYVLNIWDKTRVINLFTNNTHPNPDTWSWDINSEFWSNLGFIGTITDANNDGLHGLVTGSEADYKVSVNGDGTMSVNGLPELANTVDTMIVNEHTNAQDKVYSANYIDNNYAPLSFVSKLYFQKDTSTTASLVNNAPTISSSNYLISSTTNTDFDWNTPIFTTTRTLQANTTLNKENSFTVNLNFTIDRDADISFGAKIRVSQDNGNTWTYIGDTQGFSSVDYITGELCNAHFIVYTDLLTEDTTYNIGDLLAIEYFIKSTQSSQLNVEYACGIEIDGSNTYSYLQFNYQNMVISTDQIGDGAVTYEKLDDDLQNTIDNKLDKQTTQNTLYGVNNSGNQVQINYSSTITNNAVAQRDNSGFLSGNTPTQDSHYANKKYVDDSVPIPYTSEEIEDALNEIFFPTPTPVWNPYITFSSPNSFTLADIQSESLRDGILEYSTDTITWTELQSDTPVNSEFNGNTNVLYVRGIGNTIITGYTDGYNKWELTGSDISCSGNIETLLDYQTVLNGQHPIMGAWCFNSMFYFCSALVSAPALPATELTEGCYCQMFAFCTNLTTLPALPATTLATYCYQDMFSSCGNIFISETQTGEYQNEYTIPISGVGTDATYALLGIFNNTGGTFTDDPLINTTYYTSNTIIQPDGTIIPEVVIPE